MQLQHNCNEQEAEKLRLVEEVSHLKEQRNEQLTMQSAAASSSHNLGQCLNIGNTFATE